MGVEVKDEMRETRGLQWCKSVPLGDATSFGEKFVIHFSQ
jgi:hypothetical protein